MQKSMFNNLSKTTMMIFFLAIAILPCNLKGIFGLSIQEDLRVQAIIGTSTIAILSGIWLLKKGSERLAEGRKPADPNASWLTNFRTRRDEETELVTGTLLSLFGLGFLLFSNQIILGIDQSYYEFINKVNKAR